MKSTSLEKRIAFRAFGLVDVQTMDEFAQWIAMLGRAVILMQLCRIQAIKVDQSNQLIDHRIYHFNVPEHAGKQVQAD
jgi:hypothetical protein